MNRFRSGISAIVLAWCAIAAADEGGHKRSVGEWVAIGNRHYQAGEYDAAAQALESAYALDPKPLFLFNVAQAQRKAGHAEAALASYRRFLAVAGQSPLVPEAEQHVAALAAEVERAHAPPPAPPPTVEPPPAPPPAVEPPPAVVPPPPAVVPPPAAKAPAPAPVAERTPLYRRAGFWIGLVAAAVAVAGAVTLGVLLAPSDPTTTNGIFTLHFPSP